MSSRDLRGTWVHALAGHLAVHLQERVVPRLSCFCTCCVFELLGLRNLWEVIGRP